MRSAQSAISRFRRDLTLSALLRAALVLAAVLSLFAGRVLGIAFDATFALLIIGGLWLVLSFRSMKGSRIAADSPSLIAAGQFDVAEQHIDAALSSFSLFKNVKLISLHHLAMLRHAQRRWRESAMLAQAVLRQRRPRTPRTMSGLDKSARLILADALLEIGDVRGAYENIAPLYAQRLSLAEALTLLSVQLDYEARIGAWNAMMSHPLAKVQMAELMPTQGAAIAQAMLALAAKKCGRADWSQWLRRRVELLADPAELYADRPLWKELWAG